MKRFLAIGLLVLVAGCGTIDGIGQDISSGARKVQSWF
jgi:predicted small secreted protein